MRGSHLGDLRSLFPNFPFGFFPRADAVELYISACAMCNLSFAQPQTNSTSRAVRVIYVIVMVPSFANLSLPLRLEACTN